MSGGVVSKKKGDWKVYDAELLRRREFVFDPDFLSGWRGEPEKWYDGKGGARYRYPVFMATSQVCKRLPSRVSDA